MNNRRGQGLSTSTIILIILGVIVLVILALGFTIGWNKFLPFVSTSNIDNIKTACSTACSTQNTYDFCSYPRTVNDGTNPKFTSNCFNLSTQDTYKDYGIETCPGLCST